MTTMQVAEELDIAHHLACEYLTASGVEIRHKIPRRTVTDEVRERVLHLKACHFSNKYIAQRTGLNSGTVSRIIKASRE